MSLGNTGYGTVSDYSRTFVMLPSANPKQAMKRYALMHG